MSPRPSDPAGARVPFSGRIRPEVKKAIEDYVESRHQQGWTDLRVGHVLEAALDLLTYPEGRLEMDAKMKLNPEGFRPVVAGEPDNTVKPKRFGEYKRLYYGFEHAGRTPRKGGRYGLYEGLVYEFATQLQRDEWVAEGEKVGRVRAKARSTSGEVRAWLRNRPDTNQLFGPEVARDGLFG